MNWTQMLNTRTKRLSPSVIQEMMELVARPDCISFTAGEPSMDLHPLEKIRSAFNEVLFQNPEVLAYSDPCGDPGLRTWISDWLEKNGYVKSAPGMENILLTNGSQAGLNLLSLMFLCEGDRIMVEDPSYTEAILSFGKEGASFCPVPLDDQGPRVDVMEDILRQEKISFFYSVPTFQNPSGGCISKERKLQILDLASRYDLMIVEDDPYRELWFDCPPPPTFLSLCRDEGRVIYLGSFSKTVAPGMRCGYMVLPPKIMKKAAQLRVALEINLPSILHKALLAVIDDPLFSLHLDNLRNNYRTRRDSMVGELSEHMAPLGFEFSKPGGGFFIWGRVPGIDGIAFSKYAALNEKVGIIPGKGFFVGNGGDEYIRLSFAQVLPEDSRKGVIRLSRALEGYRSSR